MKHQMKYVATKVNKVGVGNGITCVSMDWEEKRDKTWIMVQKTFFFFLVKGIYYIGVSYKNS